MPKSDRNGSRSQPQIPCESSQEEEEELPAEEYNDDNCRLMQYITKEYGLLKLVFKYFGLKDLNMAANVCRAWKMAAEIIKAERTSTHCFLWCRNIAECSVEKLPSYLFSKFVWSEPQLCICFMTSSNFRVNIKCKDAEAPCPTGRVKKCDTSHRVIHYLRAELPLSCQCVVAECMGIVGTPHNLAQTMEIEIRRLGYSGLLLPKMPGVCATVFHFRVTSTLKSWYLGRHELENLTSANQPIKCLLLFTILGYGGGEGVGHIVSLLQSRQEERIAVGGGVFKSLSVCSTEQRAYRMRATMIVGIAFSGENVSAASTVLSSSVINRERADATIRELHENAPPSSQSIGFMFSCLGRGSNWYNEQNVETACFRSYFPDTPLVGYFGEGEIGLKYIPDTNGTPRKKPRMESPGLFHTYSTIFVNVYFGRKNPS